MSDHGRAELRSEIAAFYAGFGQPELLRRAFEQAAFVVPLVEDDRLPISRVGGIDWVCAFTSVAEYARYLMARGDVVAEHDYRYRILLGSRLSAYAESRPEPTGISIDCIGDAPMAFAPEVAESVAVQGVDA